MAARSIITHRELACWRRDPRFMLALVRDALDPNPRVSFYEGKEGLERLQFKPLAYMAHGTE